MRTNNDIESKKQQTSIHVSITPRASYSFSFSPCRLRKLVYYKFILLLKPLQHRTNCAVLLYDKRQDTQRHTCKTIRNLIVMRLLEYCMSEIMLGCVHPTYSSSCHSCAPNVGMQSRSCNVASLNNSIHQSVRRCFKRLVCNERYGSAFFSFIGSFKNSLFEVVTN